VFTLEIDFVYLIRQGNIIEIGLEVSSIKTIVNTNKLVFVAINSADIFKRIGRTLQF